MFRFTIRELILLTVIVAMGAAWWVDRRQIAELRMRNEELRWNLDTTAEILNSHGFKIELAPFEVKIDTPNELTGWRERRGGSRRTR